MPELHHPIGIDIGGTKIAVAAIHPATGDILARTSFPTEAALGFARAIDRIASAILEIDTRALAATRSHASRPTDGADRTPVANGSGIGIGIGCAGPVDPRLGLINNPYTLEGWNRCDIVRPLAERFGVRVRLENDADAAALGECWAGAGQGPRPVTMLTFGTGVGGATILDNGILRGSHGEHPEIGHIPVEPDGPPCYCGIAGCLESIASGTAIGLAGQASGLGDAREVFAAARHGHPAARAIVERATRAAATAAWTLCHTLLPHRLILGGGLMDTEFETFATPMRSTLLRATQFTPAGVEIVPARLGNDAGLVGAAALITAP